MIQSILIPFLALFIGGCSSIIGMLYMRFLPGFPLFEWWFQFIQRWETKRPNVFKVLAICADCFSGHLGWLTFLYTMAVYFNFSWYDVPLYVLGTALSAGSAILFSQIFNALLDDIKAKKQP